MADQQAAMFGECCFNTGDVKITMGTGTFMDINTGCKPHTSVAGMEEHWQESCRFVPQGQVTSNAPPFPQVFILWWDGRSAPRWFTWQRETLLTRAPPSTGRRSWVRAAGKQLFLIVCRQWVWLKSHLVRPRRQVQQGLVCGVVAELFTDVQDTSAMAYSVTDSDGVCFVPSFSGLQVLVHAQ